MGWLRWLLIGSAIAGLAALAVWGASALSVRRLAIPDEPPVAAGRPAHAATRSDVNLQIDVSLAALEALVEQQVPLSFEGEMDDPTSLLGGGSVAWRVRRGPVTLTPAADGALAFSAPIVESSATLRGQINAGQGKAGILGRLQGAIGQPFSQSVSFAGTISGTVAPQLRPDWTLAPNLTLKVAFTPPEAELFGIPLRASIQAQAERAIAASANAVIAVVETRLKSDPRIRDAAAQGWARLANSRAVAGSPPVWLRVEPVAVGLSPPVARAGFVTLALKAGVLSDVVLAAAAPPVVAPPLPPLDAVPAAPGDFALALPVAVRLADLTPLANERSFDLGVGNRRVSIDALTLGGDGGVVRVAADVTLSEGSLFNTVKARVHLSGRPVVDSAAGTVAITGLDYTVASRNAAAQAGSWLLRPVVLRQLERRAVFAVPGGNPGLRNRVNARLAEVQAALPKGVAVKLAVDSLVVSEVAVEGGWLTLFVAAHGPAVLRVNATAGFLGDGTAASVP